MPRSSCLVTVLLLSLLPSAVLCAGPWKDCDDCHPLYGDAPLVQTDASSIWGDVPILENRSYVVGYGEARMNPLWVGYRVYATAHVGAAPSHGWRIDRRTSARVSDADYKHTGYQRGHMAPRSAMYHCYGSDAVYDSYQLSNAVPQRGELNNGPWGDLEDLIRESYSIRCEEVWVIAGPVFDDANGRTYLTKDAEHCGDPQKSVEIPDAFFKILLDEDHGQIRALAFLIDHSEGYGYGAGGSIGDRLSGYLVSIDQIEECTGLDFFSDLDDAIESELEAGPADLIW